MFEFVDVDPERGSNMRLHCVVFAGKEGTVADSAVKARTYPRTRGDVGSGGRRTLFSVCAAALLPMVANLLNLLRACILLFCPFRPTTTTGRKDRL